MNADLAAALTRSLFCGARPSESRVSVYVAYSDETGTPNPDGAFVVGGYVEPESEWPHFSKRWAETVLTSPPSIPYLHMVEIRSKGFRASHGLTDADGLAKVTAGVNTIVS